MNTVAKPTISCFVLMPFSAGFSFVYEYGIKQALNDLRDKLAPEYGLQIDRADESLSTQKQKIEDVVQGIQNHDLVVVDISENNPNVMWELGFCQAQGKHIVLLSQQTQDLPFNIRGLDVLHYTFSVAGMNALRLTFSTKLKGLFPTVYSHRSSLRFDPEIERNLKSIESGLSRIPSDSILKKMASNEIVRLSARIAKLTGWHFDLRNEKPNEEIISYYCDYLSQLDNEDCSFDTVTYLDFWSEITKGGEIWNYLMANIHAAAAGVKIRRVFLVDDVDPASDKKTSLLKTVITRLKDESSPSVANMEFRLYRTQAFKQDFGTYGNFGLLRRGAQRLLFKPVYVNGNMTQTDFIYDRRDADNGLALGPHSAEIRTCEKNFERIWAKAIEEGLHISAGDA